MLLIHTNKKIIYTMLLNNKCCYLRYMIQIFHIKDVGNKQNIQTYNRMT